MYLRTIVSLLGEVYGWYPGEREYVSTVQKDGSRSIVRSRIPGNVWNYFLSGICVKLHRERDAVKNGEKIEAVMLYRGGKVRRLCLIPDISGGTFTVTLTRERDISYEAADRAMQMFLLRLESLMKERIGLCSPLAQ